VGEGNGTGKEVSATSEKEVSATVEKKEAEGKKEEKKGKKKKFHIDIFPAWCKQCGICVAFCPAEVLAQDDAGYPYAKQPEACIGCMQCELRCPDFAITVIEEETESEEQPPSKGKGLQQGAQIS